MNRTELRFTLRLIPFLDSVESVEDGLVRLRDRRWLVWHPDVMAALFRNDRALRHPPSRTLSPLLGNRSVLWLDGAEHTEYRRTLAPMLRGARYQELIEEMTARSIADLPSGPTSVSAWTRKLTLRIMGRVVFGVDDDELLTAFTRWLDRRLGNRARTLAHRYLTPGATRSDPHLDAMLLHRARTAEPPALAAFLPREDLRDQVVSLLFAGHETTASAIAWTLYWISRTPGLAGELDDDLLDATIRESLRLSPPAALAGNRMSDEGMVITPSIYLAHRRAATYENPHVFDPARKPPPPGAFFPFGGGVRHCPGKDLALLEIRLVVRALLAHRHVQLSSPTSTPQLRGAAMAPPPDLAMVATSPALIHLHRLEHPFGMHYACAAAWGACYATRFDLAVVIAVLANFVAIVSGNPLNAYADVRNDIHTADKRHLAQAVQEIGARKVLALAIFEMIFALALAAAVSWKVAAGVGLILVLYLAYNLEPVRLKRRGYSGPVVLAIAAGLLPSITAYSAAGGQADPAVWLVFSGVAALATGRALWWAVPDRAGDARVGSRTPAVLYGARHAVNATTQLTVGGLLLVGGGLWFRFGPFWAAVGVVACSAFLLARDLPTAGQQLRYGMSMAVTSTIVLAAIPLLA